MSFPHKNNLVRCRPLVLAVALLAGGCSGLPAVGPDYRQPDLQLASHWQTRAIAAVDPQKQAKMLAGWWQALGDPVLDGLVGEALQGSLDLQAAQARLRQARAARQQAVAGYAPSLTASAGASRSKTLAVPATRTLYDAGFDASWEIDLFGGTRRAVEAADADMAASQASLDNVQVSLVAEVAQNYIELRVAQQRLAIARRNLESQSATARLVAWRAEAGLASAADVEQAKTSREQTRATLPDFEISLAAAENRLTTLLGRQPGALRARLAEMQPLPEPPLELATGIPADILRQRPDLIVAERTLAAETARVGEKLAARFPSLSLGGSFGWQAYSLSALGGSGSLVRALSGTLAATLFDGGKLRSAVDLQSAKQEEALVSYQNSVLTALEEVENALTAHAQARDRVVARAAAAESAGKAARLSGQRYESGLVDFQTVLETQRTQLSTEDALATARASVLTSLVQLYKALGGGWPSQQGNPT